MAEREPTVQVQEPWKWRSLFRRSRPAAKPAPVISPRRIIPEIKYPAGMNVAQFPEVGDIRESYAYCTSSSYGVAERQKQIFDGTSWLPIAAIR